MSEHIVVRRIEVDAKVGRTEREAIQSSLVLALTENRWVRLSFNERSFDIDERSFDIDPANVIEFIYNNRERKEGSGYE